MMNNKIPIKLVQSPILEAVVEIRFVSNFPDGSIFGLLYKELKTEFQDYRELPYIQIPEHIRKQDKNLEFISLYSFENENYQVNFGNKVISIVDKKEYTGWNNYKIQIKNIMDILEKVELISKVTRIGIRYVDFFENISIQDKIKLKIQNSPFDIEKTTIETNIKDDLFDIKLHILENCQISMRNDVLIGSIIDTDVSKNYNEKKEIEQVLEEINLAHAKSKGIFFGILEDKYMKTLEPIYK